MKTKYFIISLMTIIGLVSCSEDDLATGYVDDGTGILVSVSDGFSRPQTRAVYDGFPATTFEEGDAIGIYAFNGSTYVNKNVKFTKQADGSWIPEEKVVYNPDYTYYAYFPYIKSSYDPSTSGTVNDVDTRFSSFISDNNSYFWKADQSKKENFTASNLMIAKGIVTGKRSVKFTMEHKRGMAIISDAVNKWYYTDDKDTKYSLTPIFSENIPYELNGTRYYLMKPNTATSVAGLSLRASAGKFMRSEGIEITGEPSFTYSTSTNGGSSWSGYSSSNKPSWLTIQTITEDGKTTEFGITAIATKTTNISKGTFADETLWENHNNTILKKAAVVNDIDLSMKNNDGTTRSTRTTANCYIVHAPGTYKLPLVYGNSIKNGKTNESAYYTTAKPTIDTSYGPNILNRLINHADEGIIDPWLKNNGVNVDGAELIWQDSKGLISSVGISGDYLTFSVDPNNIVEGNAVIAAKSGNTIVWSWHIWVTPETLTNLTTIDTGDHVYKVAPVNVGQINTAIGTGTIYEGSLCRIKASINNVTLMFEIKQPDVKYATSQKPHPSPYYQWGRKDAMIPSIGAFDASDNAIPGYEESNGTYVTNGNTIADGIKNPDKYYRLKYQGRPFLYYAAGNYWDINSIRPENGNATNATVKTIYDPCPPEFCVPTSNLYYYMRKNDNYNTRTWSVIPSHGVTWIKDGVNLHFPSCGYIYDGKLDKVGQYALYWSATNGWGDSGENLYGSGSEFYSNSTSKADAFPIRAVLEE